MNNFAKTSDFLKMSLPEIEKTLEKYLQIAERSDWDLLPAFENELRMLTELAKQKGSKRRW